MIDEKCKQCLTKASHDVLAKKVAGKEVKLNSKCDCPKRAAFVTLKINGELRGCIGELEARTSLYESVSRNTEQAAFHDPRFHPLRKDELEELEIEISILSEPKLLEYSSPQDLLNKLRPNIDGVIITKDFNCATFLPQVWENIPDKKVFLSELCSKARLRADEWKRGSLKVETYQVELFNYSYLNPRANSD